MSKTPESIVQDILADSFRINSPEVWARFGKRVIEGLQANGYLSPENRDVIPPFNVPVLDCEACAYDARMLMAIAESANPPKEHPQAGKGGDLELMAQNGWSVVFHYDDDGSIYYIEKFVNPEGAVIEFWEWPDETPGREALIAWRSPGDMAKLLGIRSLWEGSGP